MRRRRPGTRALTAVLAVAFVLAGLADLFHQATTRHARCAEHGELVDSGTAAEARAEAPVANAGEVTIHAAPVDSGHHQHCGFLCASPTPTLTAAHAPAPVRLAQLTTVPSLPRAATVAVTRIYRTAPKTSPPA